MARFRANSMIINVNTCLSYIAIKRQVDFTDAVQAAETNENLNIGGNKNGRGFNQCYNPHALSQL